MAQGAWDTGTWDAALWDSLPVTGNSATGSPGNVGATVTIALSGVQAIGQVGNEDEATTVPVTGTTATGAAGTVGLVITVSLSGNNATGEVGTVTAMPQPIIVIDDTHDGKRFKEILEKERKLRDAKKQAILMPLSGLLKADPILPRKSQRHSLLLSQKRSQPLALQLILMRYLPTLTGFSAFGIHI